MKTNSLGRDPKGSGSHLSGEATDVSSSLRDFDPSRVELRPDPSAPTRHDGMLPILDEAVIHGAATVHAEMMGDHDLWLGVDCADGRHVRLLVFIEDGMLRFCGEDEGIAPQGIEARSAETSGSARQGESPVGLQSDAPKSPLPIPNPQSQKQESAV